MTLRWKYTLYSGKIQQKCKPNFMTNVWVFDFELSFIPMGSTVKVQVGRQIKSLHPVISTKIRRLNQTIS